MDFILLTSLVISVFALGGSQLLIMRYRVSGYGLLAAVTTFLSAVIVVYQLSHLLPGSLGWSISIFGERGEFPGLAVSVMALIAVFFLERLLTFRRQAAKEVSSAEERATLAERAKVRFLASAAEALGVARDEAEYANRSKSEFLANMSHELRTPLNAINGFSEMMSKQMYGPLGAPQYIEYAHDIHNSGTHLLSLINDILDLSKIEAGAFELKEEEVDLAQVVAACQRIIEVRAKEAGLTLDTRLSGKLPRLRSDERAVKQIILNLLSNAVKFTPAGGKVTVHAQIKEDGCFALSVSDTGIGIDADDIPKVFAPFSQIDGSLTRKHEGTGLGLSLVKSLVEMHGGTIALESELGDGTIITIRFPAERVLDELATTKGESVRAGAA